MTPGQLWQMAIAFGLIGLFHGIFPKKFILLSQEHERPKNAEFSVPLWNFLFYLSLGFVIAFAIRTGGVLLVFSYLIVPPVSAMLLSRQVPIRVADRMDFRCADEPVRGFISPSSSTFRQARRLFARSDSCC